MYFNIPFSTLSSQTVFFFCCDILVVFSIFMSSPLALSCLALPGRLSLVQRPAPSASPAESPADGAGGGGGGLRPGDGRQRGTEVRAERLRRGGHVPQRRELRAGAGEAAGEKNRESFGELPHIYIYIYVRLS